VNILYFPNAQFGPNGLGGAIELTRQSIPLSGKEGELALGYGSQQQAKINLEFGSGRENGGGFFSFNRQQGDSYRINRLGQSDDYSANEFMFRVKEIAPPNQRNWQQTELKVHYQDYNNSESRFGISADDLAKDPMLRYAATAQDNERLSQLRLHLKHQARLDNSELVTSDFYYNDGEADLYQTSAVQGLIGTDAVLALAAFEANASGSLDIEKQGLARSFSSWGVQFKVEQQLAQHQLALGVRYHRERISDQLRQDSLMLNDQLVLSAATTENLGAYQDNADVKSVFFTDNWQQGRWRFNAGVRHEQIDISRETTSIAGESPSSSSENVTLVNAGLGYKINHNWDVELAGAQGYQPARSSLVNSQAQRSTIVRAQLNYSSDDFQFSAVIFNNDYNNLLGNCSGNANCGSTSNNVGQAQVRGAELRINQQWQLANYLLPLELVITHNEGEFTENYNVTLNSDFGAQLGSWRINDGDLLPLLPKNHAYLKIGVVTDKWQTHAQVTYRDAQLLSPEPNYDNSSQILDEVTLVNIHVSYDITSKQRVSLALSNLMDKKYAESSLYAGILAGNERTIALNYRLTF
jgi:Fe(3+) dicitrate transport protein